MIVHVIVHMHVIVHVIVHVWAEQLRAITTYTEWETEGRAREVTVAAIVGTVSAAELDVIEGRDREGCVE